MSNDDGNPFGLTPDEIDRENGWFRVALAMGKHDSFVEMLRTAGERRAAVEMSEQPKREACKKCGCYGGNGWLPRMDDTRDSCPACWVETCWCGGSVGPREPGDERGLGCAANITHDWRGGKWHQDGPDDAHERWRCSLDKCGWEPINA